MLRGEETIDQPPLTVDHHCVPKIHKVFTQSHRIVDGYFFRFAMHDVYLEATQTEIMSQRLSYIWITIRRMLIN